MRLKLHIDKIPPPQPTSPRERQLWVKHEKTRVDLRSTASPPEADSCLSLINHRLWVQYEPCVESVLASRPCEMQTQRSG